MDYTGLLLSMIVWSLFLIFGFFAEKKISTPQELLKDWYYFERFFYYSGITFIFRKFIPAKNSNRFPAGFIWLIGLYFAIYAFTAQRYENQLDKVEFKYTIFTSQIAAGAGFSNNRLMGIIQEEIPVRPIIYKPMTICKSFFYGPRYVEQFYQANKGGGENYKSANAFRQDIISEWSRKLEGASFFGAQLEGADFMYAQLKEAIFWNAQLEGANFMNAQLEGVNFARAQLKGAIFRIAQLKGAIFVNAQLEGASFFGAQLEGANFDRAQLEGANFMYAQLEGVNTLTAQQLIQAKNIYRIKNCPQNILDGIKKYGCTEMLENQPSEWSKQFIEYRKNLISQWAKEDSK